MNKKGLSLLEILISALILSLIITGLISIFVSGKRWVSHSRARMSAGELGKLFLDPFDNDIRADEWGNNCVSGLVAACPNPQTETIGSIQYDARYVSSPVAVPVPTNPPLRRVTVTINWNEPQ